MISERLKNASTNRSSIFATIFPGASFEHYVLHEVIFTCRSKSNASNSLPKKWLLPGESLYVTYQKKQKAGQEVL